MKFFVFFINFIIGVTATAAQDFVHAAAILSREESRGKSIGMVMAGLLFGILLSRVFSGAVSETYGWRVVYLIGAISITFLLVISRKYLPDFQATIAQALLAVAFSAF